MRLSVVCDFLEEDWPSMDLVADMLCRELALSPGVELTQLRPPRWALGGVGAAERHSSYRRALGRFVQYPLVALNERRRGEIFHVVDHSYAHLALVLPGARTGVFGHDCDALRPARDPASRVALSVLARTLIRGLERAAVVFYSTESVRDELTRLTRVPAERLVRAPYGIAPEFTPQRGEPDARASELPPYVLHVGSTIPRKNPGFLIELFGALALSRPELVLVQVGGTWDATHQRRIDELGLSGRVRQLRGIPRTELAALYRNAQVVLLPSLAEGFGLPVTEALASGAVLVASDLPVLREVGGDAVLYRPVGALEPWAEAVNAVFSRAPGVPSEASRLSQVSQYTWAHHARTILAAYRALA